MFQIKESAGFLHLGKKSLRNANCSDMRRSAPGHLRVAVFSTASLIQVNHIQLIRVSLFLSMDIMI